jgi:hypothetical protein
MTATTIPWGALLAEVVSLFLLLLGAGLGLIGLWALWSHGGR